MILQLFTVKLHRVSDKIRRQDGVCLRLATVVLTACATALISVYFRLRNKIICTGLF